MYFQELVSLDPSKQADVVAWHFADELQSIISEIKVMFVY